MDYFDDPSRRLQKKRVPPRIYSTEELDGFRRAAEVSRARWRNELATRGQPVYEQKRVRLRPRKKPKSEAEERSKFAAAMARSDLRSAYWSGEQDAQLRLAMTRRKSSPGKKLK